MKRALIVFLLLGGCGVTQQRAEPITRAEACRLWVDAVATKFDDTITRAQRDKIRATGLTYRQLLSDDYAVWKLHGKASFDWHKWNARCSQYADAALGPTPRHTYSQQSRDVPQPIPEQQAQANERIRKQFEALKNIPRQERLMIVNGRPIHCVDEERMPGWVATTCY